MRKIKDVVDSTLSFEAKVQTRIDYMNSLLKLTGKTEVNFGLLQECLIEHTAIYFDLVATETLSRNELQRKKKEFEMWFAEKYVAKRMEVNRPDLSAQKWANAKEFDYMIRAENKEKYSTFMEEIEELEQNLSFVEGLKKGWDTYNYTLSTLSNNVRKEVDSILARKS